MPADNLHEIVNCAAYANGHRIANVELDAVNEALKQPDRFVWIGLHEPTEETLLRVQQEFDLHELAIEDAHRAHQRPKIEVYGNSVFIVLRTAQINKEHHVEFGETHFFLGHNFIVTIRHGSSISYADVRARCEHTPHLLSKGQGFALYAVMDSIVDGVLFETGIGLEACSLPITFLTGTERVLHIAGVPVSPVLMRNADSTGSTYTLPSPRLPVCAALTPW